RSGIENKDKKYKSCDDAYKIQNGKERSDGYKIILKQIDDEGIFIPISHGSMQVVAQQDLEKVSFTQTQYELPSNELQYN
ncbi:hypothetical protein FE68_15280, partial [Staphylococcus aureus]